MTLTEARRTPVAARRLGYLVGAGINAALIVALHVWPGWRVLPFLTEDTERVLGLVTASFVAGVLVNLAYVARDPAWVRAAGDLLTATVGLAAMVRIWTVFPFDFGDYSFDWALVARIVLVVGIIGTVIGLVANTISLLRARPDRDPARTPGPGAGHGEPRVRPPGRGS